MSDWVQEFTVREVALALTQFAIARGAPTPAGCETDDPILQKVAASKDHSIYLRLRYAKSQPEASGKTEGAGMSQVGCE